MAFNGSGAFARIYSWATDKINSVPITASRMDTEMDGMATGLSTCITKNGQTTTTASIPFALGATFDAAITVPNEGLHILDTNGNAELVLKCGSNLSVDRILTLTTGDAARTLSMGGDITTAGAVTTAGAFALTLTTTEATNVTLPASGTLAAISASTWTPVLTFATPGDLSVTYAVQVGTYYVLGNLVWVSFTVTTSAFTHTTASGNLQITGLPFASKNVSGQSVLGSSTWRGITKANYTEWTPSLAANSQIILFTGSGSGQAAAALASGDMPTGGSVRFQGTLVYERA